MGLIMERQTSVICADIRFHFQRPRINFSSNPGLISFIQGLSSPHLSFHETTTTVLRLGPRSSRWSCNILMYYSVSGADDVL